MKNWIKEGDRLKVFLKEKLFFEGVAIAVEGNFLKLLDTKTNSTRIIELNGVSNIELINENETTKKSQTV